MPSTRFLKDTLRKWLSIHPNKAPPDNAVSRGDINVMRSPLLALPAELREMVLREVFRGAVVYNGAAAKSAKNLHQVMFWKKANLQEVGTVEEDRCERRQRYSEPGVLRTCRQIRAEALDIYYGSLILVFERRAENSWCTDFDHLQVFMDRLATAPRKFGHVRISLPAFVWHDEAHVGCIHSICDLDCTSGSYQIVANGEAYHERLCVTAPYPRGLHSPYCRDYFLAHVMAQVQADAKKARSKLAELGLTAVEGIEVVAEGQEGDSIWKWRVHPYLDPAVLAG